MSGIERSRPCIFSADERKFFDISYKREANPPAASERCGRDCARCGIAGVQGHSLSARSRRVLEARNRIGGRVWTHEGVEMGAEFIHGRTPEL